MFGRVGDDALVVRVIRTPIEPHLGSRCSSYQKGQDLRLARLEAPQSFIECLGMRYREHVRSSWPSSFRFQTVHRSWCTSIASFGGLSEQVCILQMPEEPEDRTLQSVELGVQDAKDAASYAYRFNMFLLRQQGLSEATDSEKVPGMKVAAPVICEVVHTGYPSMIPTGGLCTLTQYNCREVIKFVFDGSEDFQEMPQAFFHFAAHSSGGKEFVCDLQGDEDEAGNFLLIDPVLLRAGLPGVGDLVSAGMRESGMKKEMAGTSTGPTKERFDQLHPKCAQMCKEFDPQRKGAVKSIGGMCGFNSCSFGV